MRSESSIWAQFGLVAALCLFAMPCASAPLYYLATGHTGAQTQIDINHTSDWLMRPNIDFDFGGGLFVMKDGPSTTSTVRLSLYEGFNASGLLLGTVEFTNSQFCAPVGNCQSFTTHQFLFGTPLLLSANTVYYAALTSQAIDAQATAYFIKNDNYFISDINSNAIIPSPADINTSDLPEPQSFALLALGLGFVWAKRQRIVTLATKKEN